MEHTSVCLHNKIELKDRILLFDGDSVYYPNNIDKLIANNGRYVTELTDEIKQYNKLVSSSQRFEVKTDCQQFEINWNIPDYYKTLDVQQYVFDQHIKLTGDCSDTDVQLRDQRLITELIMFKKRNLFPFLQGLIWVINSLLENDIVWGVGRGSSVASYLLYVIGVHDVDSFEYQLDINDFFH